MGISASERLLAEVVNSGLCSRCGACIGGCPYLVYYRGRVVSLDNCTLSEGQCYQYCPHTYTDLDALSRGLFGVPYGTEELGRVKEVLIARAADSASRERGQYGGTVTSLLSLALTEGLIEAAILTKLDQDQNPVASLARSREAILEAGGVSYEACPTLEAWNRLPRDSQKRVGVVATPCQATAIAKMRVHPPQNRANTGNVRLVLGLFCTWALAPEEFHRYLSDNLDLPQVVKFDIPPPPAERFDVYTRADKVSFPLQEVRKFVLPACGYCLDMTSELADISVGAVEGMEGWNTVIVRSDAGIQLIEMARARGVLETGALPPGNLAHLKEAAWNKKKRALANRNKLSVSTQQSVTG
ncbi:MAG: Coenzyme F420 hydrogenase/dehydrogenase, beta subunit C-terminal domain [Chloroflexota bacterium]